MTKLICKSSTFRLPAKLKWLLQKADRNYSQAVNLWTSRKVTFRVTVLINSYSFLVVGLLAILLVSIAAWRLLNPSWTIAIAVSTFVLLSAFQLVTSTREDEVTSLEDFDNVLKSGKPVLLELYSNFWVVCLQAKPAVDRLKSNLSDEFVIVRIDINSDVGGKIRQKYQTRLVPTFVAFDKGGTEVWRRSGKVPHLEEILLLNL